MNKTLMIACKIPLVIFMSGSLLAMATFAGIEKQETTSADQFCSGIMMSLKQRNQAHE